MSTPWRPRRACARDTEVRCGDLLLVRTRFFMVKEQNFVHFKCMRLVCARAS